MPKNDLKNSILKLRCLFHTLAMTNSSVSNIQKFSYLHSGLDGQFKMALTSLLTIPSRIFEAGLSFLKKYATFLEEEKTSNNDQILPMRKQLVCNYCKRRGHSEENCWYKTSRGSSQRPNNFSSSSEITMLISNSDNIWLLDSGSNSHWTNSMNDFVPGTFKQVSFTSTTANSSALTFEGFRNVNIFLTNLNINIFEMRVENAHFSLTIFQRIFSKSQIIFKGFLIIKSPSECIIQKDSCKVCAFCNPVTYLHYLGNFGNGRNILASNISDWHRRLDHVNTHKIFKISRNDSMNWLNIDCHSVSHCNICNRFKMTRKDHPTGHILDAKDVLERVFTDLYGLYPELLYGHEFFLLYIDQFSRKTWIYPIKFKSQHVQTFDAFKRRVENQTGKTIKFFRSDGGTEFIKIK